jgi:uncharacterized membrane protein
MSGVRHPRSFSGPIQLAIVVGLMFGLATLFDAIGLGRDDATAAGIVMAGVAFGLWAGLAGRRLD